MSNVRRKKSYEAFLDGYKPAVLELKSSPHFNQLSKYPYICPFNSRHSEGCIFFRTEKQKQEYERQVKNVEEDSPQWHYIVGIVLGFPEQSINYFSQIISDKQHELRKYDMGMSWAGFHLKTNSRWIEDEVKWLWDTYIHPKAIGNPVHVWTKELDLIEIPYHDFDGLTEVCEYIRREQGVDLLTAVTNK